MSLKKFEKTADNTYTLEVQIEPEVFAEALDKVTRTELKKITIPGFRKGKAPKSVVDQLYGKEFFFDKALNKIAPDHVENAIEESKLEVIEVASEEAKEISLENGALIEVVCIIYPSEDVSIEGYKGLEIEGEEVTVSDEEVTAELESLRQKHSRILDIEDRPIKDGDEVKLSYAGSVDGVPFDGGADEDATLKIGSGQFIPGFEDQLIGHSLNEAFDINVKFPEDYHAEDLAGKDAVFAVVIKGIQETELPVLDDEFAKDASEFDTLDEYTEDLKSRLLKKAEEQETVKRKNRLATKLADIVEVDVPDILIDKELRANLREFEHRLSHSGLDLKTYMRYMGETPEGIAEKMRPQAEEMVLIRLALEEVARLEGIVPTEEELAEKTSELAKEMGIETDKLSEYVDTEYISKDVIYTKAMDFLLENAKIIIEAEISEQENAVLDE